MDNIYHNDVRVNGEFGGKEAYSTKMNNELLHILV